ncbi:cellulase family glycosylhydrolase [Pseudonocardia sp. KRD-184]|uniref:Cellulase family glycosylhydrolase n=1 Tax=Pseudonocardia oceani TaxID=2792013 RepID=A0ABS6U5N9_9PSEU|nr:cellulase family glycosylhydrolase [Pseudonocardia oceani]MBW0089586.1 cellulase family glycosylhydrolase [Pseudonocardia oceani]MBW0096512.1 cellulase family glycosylhydrolase [Pseudonocardia oceani]MBW0122747.1 cellulase family glycosylhydrolase [Pseudonocardia oceani]MBW0127474.1 cellulase family glycosylhydrolase [Pseudonocardia oceani]
MMVIWIIGLAIGVVGVIDRQPKAVGVPALPALGVTVHLEGVTDAQRRKQFADLAAAGATWIRIGAPWYAVQPDSRLADEAALAALDTVLSDATSAGLQVLFIGDQAPSWAGGDSDGTASNPSAYGDFMGLLAERFRGRGPGGASPAYEIMNEPNGLRADGQLWAQPAQYSAASCAAFRAIKAQDRGAAVIAGSLDVRNWEQWLDSAFEAGLGGCFDALSAHPYSDLAVLDEVRAVAAARGNAAVRIWVTEFGFSTCSEQALGCVNEREQASLTVERLRLMRDRYPWVETAMIYQDRDEPNNPGPAPERSFGLFRSGAVGDSFTPKPVVGRLRELYRSGAN